MFAHSLALLSLLPSLIRGSTALSCAAEDIPTPQLFGIEIIKVLAVERTDFEAYGAGELLPIAIESRPISFCNVTIEHTHLGLNDTIHTYIWLPLEGWNGNFMAQGGGGWAAGSVDSLGAPVNKGYATAVTDGGHNIFGNPYDTALTTASWSLASPGNVNMVLLEDFAFRALDDMTHLAKHVIKRFYGKPAKYSYWHGCSTGGRQGLVQAQRFPGNYDGILTACPAINWVNMLLTEHWAHVVMKKLKYYPPACELNAFTSAATEACDKLDGVRDGVVSAPGLCKFDPQSLIGQKFDCAGDERRLTPEAAEIAANLWHGPIQDGEKLWYGVTPDASLVGWPPMALGLAATTCDDENKNCKSHPFACSADWIRHFIAQDPQFDTTSWTEADFFEAWRTSRQRYFSIIDTAEADLRAFKATGGKILHWHGLADQLISPNGSSHYYERVRQLVPDVDSFYRYFEVPGVTHCYGGLGAAPSNALEALVDWVEKGIAPEQLEAATVPSGPGEKVKTRPLCQYPLVAAFKGGDPDQASSFECAKGFDVFDAQKHDEL